MARAAVSQSSGDQLAWDFDDPDAGEAPPPVENEGAARFAPGSSQRVAALQSTDADAARLDLGWMCPRCRTGCSPPVGTRRGMGRGRPDRLLHR